MKCPFCRDDNDRVIDTRAAADGFAVRRRRQCDSCQRRYTTYERIDAPIKVVKKDGTREPFDRQKFKLGLEKACWKRPVGDTQIEAVISGVENDVETTFDTEVDSHYLGELAMRHLRDLDEVAYVRFASVYRQFKDVQDFVNELKPMLATPPEPDRPSGLQLPGDDEFSQPPQRFPGR